MIGQIGVSTGLYGTKLFIDDDIPHIVEYKDKYATFPEKTPYAKYQ